MHADAPIGAVRSSAYTVPTDRPEADGTQSWAETTLVLAEVEAGGRCGIGYTYADAACVGLIGGKLAGAIDGVDAADIPRASRAMQSAVRNLGRQGLAATAIAAVDIALWDLKAKLYDLPLCTLLGRARDEVPVYGSGGFTTYPDPVLAQQLHDWVERDGCCWVKMKIGTEPERDPARVAVARRAIGEAAGLFVDANGAFSAQAAIGLARRLRHARVSWFEEPVSSDDLAGLRQVRAHVPAGMDVAAGEYAYETDYVRRMLAAGAVDVQQVDATRCLGISGFLAAASLCEAQHVDLSGHCAPAAHLHAALAAPRLRHLEWFHDHVRIERMLFDGAPRVTAGAICADLSRPGLGLAFRHRDAARFLVS